MRNNQDRMGMGVPTMPNENLQSSIEPPPQPAAMDFLVPTEIVDLPSKGLFYDEDHPLHKQTTIEIKHMTTKEEDILTNQSYLKNGSAIDRVLRSVVVDNRININDLLIGDKNAITVACRVFGYGQDYQTKYSCPSCGASQITTFDLAEIESVDFEEGLREFDATIDYETNLINFVIPRTKVQLQLNLLRKSINEGKKKKKESRIVRDLYKAIIHSVNGNADANYISSYIDSMSAIDSRYLRSAYKKMVPNLDMACQFECKECGHEGEVEVPLSADFFWPGT